MNALDTIESVDKNKGGGLFLYILYQLELKELP